MHQEALHKGFASVTIRDLVTRPLAAAYCVHAAQGAAHTLLNAKQDKEEAHVVEAAGTVEAYVAQAAPVFERYARVLTKVSSPVLVTESTVGKTIVRLLVRYAQGKAERHTRIERLKTVKQDRKL